MISWAFLEDAGMYDVAQFVKPTKVNPERSGEYIGGETQDKEFFRYERNHSFVSECIRKSFEKEAT